ncbi:MAG: leucine-rich repeat domain-containing protein [Oscillospiraceae bacterium]|nr:leucine-rich repeat domain-containing protein [Oscillospiraceae bacterium]
MSAIDKLLIKLGLKDPPKPKPSVSPAYFRAKAFEMRADNYKSKYNMQRVGHLIDDLEQLWQNDIQTSYIDSIAALRNNMNEYYDTIDEYALLLETAAQELEANTSDDDRASVFASDGDGPVSITLSHIPYLRRTRIDLYAEDPYFLMTQEGVSAEVVDSRKNSEYMYNVYSDHIELVKYIGYLKTVEVPAQIDGLPVTHIGCDCFAIACHIKITSVSLPETITTILSGAFRGCRQIRTLDLPSSLRYIGNYAFSFLVSLETLRIPDNVVSMGFGAFRNCISLVSVEIPEGTLRIGNDCFYRCTELKTVNISNGVVDIDGWSFRMCDNLESVTIGDSVVNIGDSVFYECVCLDSIEVPGSVEKIGDTAFYSRRGITVGCEQGSYAQQYAVDNKLKYRVVNEPV